MSSWYQQQGCISKTFQTDLNSVPGQTPEFVLCPCLHDMLEFESDESKGVIVDELPFIAFRLTENDFLQS